MYTYPLPFLPPFLRTDLQPSHSFFTELLTFIPRTCSPIPFCAAFPANALPNIVGLRKDCGNNADVESNCEDIVRFQARLIMLAECREGRKAVRMVCALRTMTRVTIGIDV